MTQTPENPPAFPWLVVESATNGGSGMDLRDWFAGMALPAVIAATSAGQHQPGTGFDDPRPMTARMACDAYELADAMLAARAQEPGT